MNKIFGRFRRRLMLEAIGKASLMGALIGASVELIFLVVMHLISRDPEAMWINIVFAAPFCIAFALFFGIAYYPTQKRVAKRIDESGLQERAGTMLQFKDQRLSAVGSWRICLLSVAPCIPPSQALRISSRRSVSSSLVLRCGQFGCHQRLS